MLTLRINGRPARKWVNTLAEKGGGSEPDLSAAAIRRDGHRRALLLPRT